MLRFLLFFLPQRKKRDSKWERTVQKVTLCDSSSSNFSDIVCQTVSAAKSESCVSAAKAESCEATSISSETINLEINKTRQ